MSFERLKDDEVEDTARMPPELSKMVSLNDSVSRTDEGFLRYFTLIVPT